MNNVVISLYEAYPPASGCANVTFNFTRYLPGKRYLFQFSTKEGEEVLEKDFIIKNFYLPSHQRIKKIITLIRTLPVFIREIKKIEPDNIFIEGASGAILLLYVLERLKNSGIKSTFVYHSHNVEYELRKQKEKGWITLLTRMSEDRLLDKVDYITAVSEEDISIFRKLYGKTPYFLANGVDIESFESVTKNKIKEIKDKYNLKGNILFFMGLPDYKPNKEAINFIDKKLMPEVVSEYPYIRVAIIGGKVGFDRKWLINPGSIPFEEVPAFIKACDICLAPIFSGSGTRLKILEYMASEKPVISTTKGAEGIAVNNKKNIVIIDDIYKFAEQIIYILEHEKFAKEIGYEGMKTVRATYSWQKIMQNFNKTLYTERINNRMSWLP